MFFSDMGPYGEGLSAQLCILLCFIFDLHVFSLYVLSNVFSPESVVEAAPQERPKTTPVSNTALRPLLCSPSPLNALPVPLPIQVYFPLFWGVFFRVRFQWVVSTRFFSFPVFLGPWGEVFLVPF